MFDWFKKEKATPAPLTTDVHSHLLPGLDDGVKTLEESLALISTFRSLGYRKLITTPHVMSDAYRNTSDDILGALHTVRSAVAEKSIHIDLQAAAEYYLEEDFFRRVESGEKVLTFGNNLLLFETNFMTEPLNLKEFIFIAHTKGYKLVLAHPERYVYMHNDLAKMEDLLNRGVQFQLNISSLTGYYSKGAQFTAQKMIDRGWVHLLGSDCHHEQHLQLVKSAQGMKYFQKALSLPLLNHSI
ncbi:MAG: capsular biosynthesis protein [Bacteroidia bacterium]|nr:capsular biosynthesis protein [Bacteroidia bacterium]